MSSFIQNLNRPYGRTFYPTFQPDNYLIDKIEEKTHVNLYMDAFQYERIFVQVVEEIAAKKGLNGAQLARLAWPHQRAAATAWRRMRNNQKNPKRLNIEEAFLLTQAIGISMSDVCGIVQGRMLNINTASQSQPNFHREKKEKSGKQTSDSKICDNSTLTDINTNMEENFEKAE